MYKVISFFYYYKIRTEIEDVYYELNFLFPAVAALQGTESDSWWVAGDIQE